MVFLFTNQTAYSIALLLSYILIFLQANCLHLCRTSSVIYSSACTCFPQTWGMHLTPESLSKWSPSCTVDPVEDITKKSLPQTLLRIISCILASSLTDSCSRYLLFCPIVSLTFHPSSTSRLISWPVLQNWQSESLFPKSSVSEHLVLCVLSQNK